jgi:predicted PhzF superfamily epimerase YddE/YHI9
MTDLHVLRVFIGPDGRGGNRLGVFLDGPAIEPGRRQEVAAELGFSETVWVDEVSAGAARISIFTPAREMPFAGHPTVGTAWLLRDTGRPVETLRVPAGDVGTWGDVTMTWVRARAAWAAGLMDPRQLPSPSDVDALETGAGNLYAWAWEDEAAGRVRSRFLALDFGIVEDEATGAAAVVLGDRLGRPITIRQGIGSEIVVRPDPVDGTVAIGGRVELVEIRRYS